MSFKRIDTVTARQLIAASPENGLQIVDVRDERSYEGAHIEGAHHLDNTTLSEFLQSADQDKPLLVYCYHGNMSQGAAAFFAEQGFVEAYSLDGGFEAWQGQESDPKPS